MIPQSTPVIDKAQYVDYTFLVTRAGEFFMETFLLLCAMCLTSPIEASTDDVGSLEQSQSESPVKELPTKNESASEVICPWLKQHSPESSKCPAFLDRFDRIQRNLWKTGEDYDVTEAEQDGMPVVVPNLKKYPSVKQEPDLKYYKTPVIKPQKKKGSDGNK
jgi:hypothetical protein